MKEIKRVNGFFLVLVLIRVGMLFLVSYLDTKAVKMGTYTSLMLTQLLILVPSFMFFLISGYDVVEWIPFKKLRAGTAALVVLFAFMIMPFLSLINVFSQLFTSNEAINMFSEVNGLSPLLTILIVGLFGPFCEEFTFRGVIYGGLRKSGYLFAAAVVTGITFGLMHLNLNQLSYALVLGIILCLVNEAAGSMWASIIVHVVINTWNMLMMLVAEKFYSSMGIDILKEIQVDITTDDKLGLIGLYLVVSVVTVMIAVGVFISIASHEGRADVIRHIFNSGEDGEKDRHVVTVSGYIGAGICVFLIFLLKPLISLLVK